MSGTIVGIDVQPRNAVRLTASVNLARLEHLNLFIFISIHLKGPNNTTYFSLKMIFLAVCMLAHIYQRQKMLFLLLKFEGGGRPSARVMSVATQLHLINFTIPT